MNMGRVLVIVEDPGVWVNTPYCTDSNLRTLDECYFEPMSSCSRLDVPPWGAVPGYDPRKDQSNETYVSGSMHVIIQDYKMVPDVFKDLLQQSSIPVPGWSFWWRCQVSAFIVRPNLRTLHAIHVLKMKTFGSKSIAPGTIGIHIRRGDKKTEAPNMIDSTEPFLATAEKLKQMHSQLTTRIYLGTEDNNTLHEMVSHSQWQFDYTDVERYPACMASSHCGPIAHARRIGPEVEFLNSLVSLDLILSCDAFVGVMESNWVRLIDELRSTVRCKANRPFEDPERPFGNMGVQFPNL
jgi:hypothetical protein